MPASHAHLPRAHHMAPWRRTRFKYKPMLCTCDERRVQRARSPRLWQVLAALVATGYRQLRHPLPQLAHRALSPCAVWVTGVACALGTLTPVELEVAFVMRIVCSTRIAATTLQVGARPPAQRLLKLTRTHRRPLKLQLTQKPQRRRKPAPFHLP